MVQAGQSVTSAFIDLATFDGLEGYLYGGDEAVTYFVRQTRKSTWFSQIPVTLTNAGSNGNFDQTYAVSISRSGDYLLNTWLSFTTPTLKSASGTTMESGDALRVGSSASGSTSTICNQKLFLPTGGSPAAFSSVGATGDVVDARWAKNLGHNLIKTVSIKFNDLVASTITREQLDFWSSLTIPQSQLKGYRQMIGAGEYEMGADGREHWVRGLSCYSPHDICVPIPFFFTRDSGVALPTAALPYNEMRIEFEFETRPALMTAFKRVQATTSKEAIQGWARLPTLPTLVWADSNQNGSLLNVQVWGNYAVVSNAERKMMGAHSRDIAIETFQQQKHSYSAASSDATYAIRFSHGVKALMFGVQSDMYVLDSNVSSSHTQSVYGVGHAVVDNISTSLAGVKLTDTVKPYGGAMFSNYTAPLIKGDPLSELIGEKGSVNPIDTVTLLYENAARLSEIKSNYYSHVNPYYTAEAQPEEGVMLYSYALKVGALDPCGSTNYGKLTNVLLQAKYKSGKTGAGGQSVVLPTDSLANWIGDPAVAGKTLENTTQTLVVTALANNIIRISGGALGFPIL